MPLAHLWGKLNPTNLIAEFVIVTLSVVVALAGDKYLSHRATLEQERKALMQIHEDIKRDYIHLQHTIDQGAYEDTIATNLLRHGARDTTLQDSTINALFLQLLHFRYFDRTVASTVNYDAKIKNAGRQIISSDSLAFKLGKYYDSSLNNLTLWTEGRREVSNDLVSVINQERGYLDNGSKHIHNIREKSFHEVLDAMTSNIRIMGLVSDFLGFNDGFISHLRYNSENQREAIKAIEAYFVENDVDYVPFDPEATWSQRE